MKILQPAIEHLLAVSAVARLATLNPDGSPHQVPIVFSWHQGCFWSPIDGKPKRSAELARVRNARHKPAGSLLIDQYNDDWAQLWWIRADVQIEVVLLAATDSQTAEIARQAIQNLEKKYGQYETIPVLREPATMLSMRVTTITSWCVTQPGLS